VTPVTLAQFWFILIAVLWTGFFVLEGFDLGVGMLHGIIGHDEAERRMVINTIGPLWDGNEVWLIVAGAAIFAAFPGWYATMFSGFYLALVLLLAALMARGTSFEFRRKRDSAAWRRMWDGLLTGGSLLVPLLIGIALGDLLHGLPIDKSQNYTGSFWDLLQPYGIYTGITLVAICILHGATFVTLKTTGEVTDRAARVAARSGPIVALIVIGWAIWTHITAGKGFWPNPVEIGILLVVIAAAWLAHDRREGWSFACTTITIGLAMLTLFTDLYPNVMISSTNSAYNLTIANTASPSYTLKLMSIVAVILLPVVLAYTAWNYYVFRRRLTASDFQPAPGGPATSPSTADGTGRTPEPDRERTDVRSSHGS
jgi:cytochrome d ubiquinol oxidase subunit II